MDAPAPAPSPASEPAPNSPSGDATAILGSVAAGDRDAAARLMPLVYDELRALAASYLKHERKNHTLQPTAIVNEAYLRLIDQTHADYKSRTHFFAIGAQMVRRVLVDHARKHLAAKRGGGGRRVTLSDAMDTGLPEQDVDLVALDDALRKLAELDERQCKVVELRFFGGLSVEETAAMLKVSTRTIEQDWRMAKAWLRSQLTRPDDAP
jgi:RNA polymerase sigma-70 factor, ECF subfamily